MNNIRYFFKQALRSMRRGKFHARSWKQLLTIILLESECILLTGRTLDEIRKTYEE